MRRLLFVLLFTLVGLVPASAQTTIGHWTSVVLAGHAVSTGTGSPETVVVGSVGDVYLRTDATGGIYQKLTGTATNTGWILSPGSALASPQYVTLATDSVLTSERVLTGTSNQLGLTDGGAGSTVTLALTSPLAFPGESHCALFDEGNSGTTLTVDLGTHCNRHKVTLTGNVTLTFTNPRSDGIYTFLLDTGAGSFTVTWPASVLWSGGSAPTITTTASKTDLVTCQYRSDTSKYLCSITQNF